MLSENGNVELRYHCVVVTDDARVQLRARLELSQKIIVDFLLDRFGLPAAVTKLAEGGVPVSAVEVVAEEHRHTLASNDDWWALVLGSGYRGTLEQLAPAERAAVRETCLAFVRDEGVFSVEANVVYAVAAKA